MREGTRRKGLRTKKTSQWDARPSVGSRGMDSMGSLVRVVKGNDLRMDIQEVHEDKVCKVEVQVTRSVHNERHEDEGIWSVFTTTVIQ